MAPVTRRETPTSNGFTIQHNKIYRNEVLNRNTSFKQQYTAFRFVHCTVHLDQIQRNKTGLKTMPKLDMITVRNDKRIIHPLIFRPFVSGVLRSPSEDGNVTFIIDLNTLLSRFSVKLDFCNSKHFSQRVLLTRPKREIGRYALLPSSEPEVPGGVWWRDDEQHHLLGSADLKHQVHGDLTFHVDVLPTDFLFLRKYWVEEFLDHETCSSRGELCTNLMDRGVAWEACHGC